MAGADEAKGTEAMRWYKWVALSLLAIIYLIVDGFEGSLITWYEQIPW